VLPPEADAGVCAPLRNRGRPSCDKLAHPTLPRRIVHDDRNISFLLAGIGARRASVRSWRTRLARDAGTYDGTAINQGACTGRETTMKMRSISLVAATRRTAALAQGNAAPGITRKK
jgi:hypothetical protein